VAAFLVMWIRGRANQRSRLGSCSDRMQPWVSRRLAAGSVFCPISRNISTTATFAWMAIVTGFAVAVGIFLVVVLFTHAVRDLQSAPSYHRLCHRLRKGS
jgi:hypothetical protein